MKEYDIISDYVNFLGNHFSHLKNLDLNICVDCGNGTAGVILSPLIQAMNWSQVHLLFEKIDGDFPNHPPDPINRKNMEFLASQLINHPQIAFGIGLDGDSDRMCAMTKQGYLIPGDQLLAVFANQVIQENPGSTIVFDVRMSSNLIESIEKSQGKGLMSPCGRSIIMDEMVKNNALLGGERSCHFFFNDRYFGYDDGIYSMLRLIEIITQKTQPLEDIIKIFPSQYTSEDIRFPCPESEKQTIIEHMIHTFSQKMNTKIITIDGARISQDDGLGIICPSVTEPILYFRFESSCKEGLQKIKEDFLQALLPFFEKELLEEKFDLSK